MPKIAYIEKNFRRESLALIERVNSVIAEYRAQEFDLTLRQVYYQLVARDIIPNNERSYKNLGELISNARLAGLIDWNAIEDRTRELRSLASWGTPKDIIETAASQYHRDWWEGQTNYVEVWVEKDALIGIVGQICKRLDVPHFSCRGYVSQSELWGAAQRLQRHEDIFGMHPVLLHLGDHDPSGKDMSRDIVDRLELFEVYDVEFHRLALNMNQIEEYGPPPNPTKLTDSRASGYISKYGYECWELDALEPRVISDLIETNVLKYRDEAQYQKVKQRERDERKQLRRLRDGYDVLAERWDEIAEEYDL